MNDFAINNQPKNIIKLSADNIDLPESKISIYLSFFLMFKFSEFRLKIYYVLKIKVPPLC